MSAADIGSFDWLSIWNLSPVMAALVVLLADFGVVNVLMLFEGYPRRGRYLNFIVNDVLLYPVAAAMAVVVLREGTPTDGAFYLEPGWHLACLLVPLALSVCLEIGAVRSGMFTMAQELSPSKLWHTLAFAVMGYWIIAPIPAMFDLAANDTASLLPFTAWLSCLVVSVPFSLSGKVVYPFGSRTEPHIEWSWPYLVGTPRD